MGSVRQRRGKWQAMYRDPDGKQRGRSFASKREAERFLARTQVGMEKGEWRDPSHGKRTFEAVAATWLAQKQGLRPGTLANYESITRCHLIPEFGPIPVAKITPDMVRTWLGRMRANVGASAVAKTYRVLASIMDMAVDDRLIPSSPVPTRHRPVSPEAAEMMFLSSQQVHDLAEAIGPHYSPLVWTAADTGMRIGELIGLRVKRVDLLRRRIEVCEQVTDVNGYLNAAPPKTKAGRRMIDLSSFLAGMLQDHIAGKGLDDLVFTSERGGMIRRANFRKRVWLPAVARAGLGGLRFHDLRHTHTAWLIRAEVPSLEITERLGHTRVAFTLDRYGHLFEGAGTAADRLDALHRATKPAPTASITEIR